jgi:5-methyltetrahydropteroyltriglutamate--homocysteine methyltransferase
MFQRTGRACTSAGGIYDGPHTRDIPGFKVLPVVLKAKPGALLIEGANPRHEHEWELWKTIKPPQDKVLVPCMIGSSTNYVEHPELVAQRIMRYADILGRENVMGGTDCGFGTWLKLKSLADGAKITSQKLWG